MLNIPIRNQIREYIRDERELEVLEETEEIQNVLWKSDINEEQIVQEPSEIDCVHEYVEIAQNNYGEKSRRICIGKH